MNAATAAAKLVHARLNWEVGKALKVPEKLEFVCSPILDFLVLFLQNVFL